MTRDNNRFLPALDLLSCQSIYLPLVHSQLANINIQKENISALHTRIEHLGHRQVVRFASSHNLRTFFNSVKRVVLGNSHYFHPILVWSLIDEVRGPKELYIGHFHSRCLPNLHKVSSDGSNFLQIAHHFLIKHCEPVCYPKYKNASCVY